MDRRREIFCSTLIPMLMDHQQVFLTDQNGIHSDSVTKDQAFLLDFNDKTFLQYRGITKKWTCPNFIMICLGLNEKCKGNEPFIDLLSGTSRLDKVRQEKLKRFRESLTSKLNHHENDDGKTDDHRTVFNIPWKENAEFQLDDPDYQRYLRTLHAAVFLRIKSSSERQIDASPSSQLKYPEHNYYNETLVHLTHYQNLLSRTCLGFDNFIQNNSSLKQWLTLAQTDEHYPLLVMGSRASGKTLLCTKLVQYLVNTLGKNSQCIIRYFNLTTKSRHITELFGSICTQMNVLQNGSSPNNEQEFNRIEYYQSVLNNLSKNQKPLILMIDGIEEIVPQNQQTSTFVYYSTLLQLLPPKVGKEENIVLVTDRLSGKTRLLHEII